MFAKDASKSRKYWEGIVGNLEAMIRVYGSEWTLRLYHNLGDISRILPNHPQFISCDIQRNPLLANASILLPTFWRFLPILDDQVSRFSGKIRPLDKSLRSSGLL